MAAAHIHAARGRGEARGEEGLAKDPAVAAADDEDRLRVGVRVERQLRDHLLVRVLVALGELNDAVEHEHLHGRPQQRLTGEGVDGPHRDSAAAAPSVCGRRGRSRVNGGTVPYVDDRKTRMS